MITRECVPTEISHPAGVCAFFLITTESGVLRVIHYQELSLYLNWTRVLKQETMHYMLSNLQSSYKEMLEAQNRCSFQSLKYQLAA